MRKILISDEHLWHLIVRAHRAGWQPAFGLGWVLLRELADYRGHMQPLHAQVGARDVSGSARVS